MFSSLNRRHLFKEIFASKESDTGEEGKHSNSYSIIASIMIFIIKTYLFSAFLFYVSFVAYASEYNYCEELKN